ncbi:MAG TPA: NmrA family NAD(P)-binding protein [Candidatus Sulfotelmatobacter sp.]|nr:NmrA family NAD(P)-binding protein [Candidatus Sulfotelmatobacter sp.]
MYVITGITGQIGGVIGRALLEAKQPVRAVVRNADKGREWRDRGCELALADIGDASSLADSFQGAEAVFILVPPSFDPSPDFSEARAIGAALKSALEAACQITRARFLLPWPTTTGKSSIARM